MNSPLVSILILNWNGASLIEECLESVQKSSYNNIEIIVVDNASTDNSMELLRKYTNVKVIQNEINLGYAAGNNVGLKHVAGKYIVTLNNDVSVDKSWLTDPISYLEADDKVGIVSCRQINYYNRDLIDALFPFPHRSLVFAPMGHNKQFVNDLFEQSGYVIGANGASAIYRKKMLDEIGGFDENFYAYHEECDLCMRAFLLQWKCLYLPSAIVYHKMNISFKKIPAKLYFYSERNRFYFLYKYYPLAFIAKNLVGIIFNELLMVKFLFLQKRLPLIYFRSRFAGLIQMYKYKNLRQKNIELFKNRQQDFEYFMKHKIQPLH